jgi:hypothetical protein
MLVCRGRPWDAPNAVESNQAEFRSEPEITIARLRNRVDGASEKALADLPSVVRVLTDVERRI